MAQRIAQYNREVGQPRGGLVSPELLTVTQLDDGYGELDSTVENIRNVGPLVHYLSRLTGVLVASQVEAREAAESIFRASLAGAGRLRDAGLFPEAHDDALKSLRDLSLSTYADGVASFELDECAVRAACRLASYEVAQHAGVTWYDPADIDRSPDAKTLTNIIMMTERTHDFLREHGPATAVEFSFASGYEEDEEADGYLIALDAGDGDLITEEAVWDYKARSSPPSKDHLLKLLVHYLMGKDSGLPRFRTQTHLGIFNPRLNAVYQLAVDDIPAHVIKTVRRDVIGSGRIEP
ncbi:hypothetical protein [Microbacterium sp. KNMS]